MKRAWIFSVLALLGVLGATALVSIFPASFSTGAAATNSAKSALPGGLVEAAGGLPVNKTSGAFWSGADSPYQETVWFQEFKEQWVACTFDAPDFGLEWTAQAGSPKALLDRALVQVPLQWSSLGLQKQHWFALWAHEGAHFVQSRQRNIYTSVSPAEQQREELLADQAAVEFLRCAQQPVSAMRELLEKSEQVSPEPACKENCTHPTLAVRLKELP